MAVVNLPRIVHDEPGKARAILLQVHERSWPEPRVRASSEASLFEFIDDGDGNDGADSSGGRGNSSESHCNSRSFDRVDNICTDNSHTRIRTGSSETRNPDIRIRFPLKLARQNAVTAPKQLHTPAMLSREFFSLSLPSLVVLRETKAAPSDD